MFNTSLCDAVGPGETCMIDCAAPFVRVGNWTTGQCPKGNSIPRLGTLFCYLHCFAPWSCSVFFLNMLNNWKMLYDCYWLVPVNSLKSSQQNSQIKASFFCLETWVSLFIAAQPRDRMVMWSEPTCICPEPDAQQGYAQDDLQTYHSEWDISSLWFPCFAFSTAF